MFQHFSDCEPCIRYVLYCNAVVQYTQQYIVNTVHYPEIHSGPTTLGVYTSLYNISSSSKDDVKISFEISAARGAEGSKSTWAEWDPPTSGSLLLRYRSHTKHYPIFMTLSLSLDLESVGKVEETTLQNNQVWLSLRKRWQQPLWQHWGERQLCEQQLDAAVLLRCVTVVAGAVDVKNIHTEGRSTESALDWVMVRGHTMSMRRLWCLQ